MSHLQIMLITYDLSLTLLIIKLFGESNVSVLAAIASERRVVITHRFFGASGTKSAPNKFLAREEYIHVSGHKAINITNYSKSPTLPRQSGVGEKFTKLVSRYSAQNFSKWANVVIIHWEFPLALEQTCQPKALNSFAPFIRLSWDLSDSSIIFAFLP